MLFGDTCLAAPHVLFSNAPAFFIHEVIHGTALHFFHRVTENFCHLGIHKGRIVVRIDSPDAFLCRFNNRAISRFTLTQCFLSTFLFREINP